MSLKQVLVVTVGVVFLLELHTLSYSQEEHEAQVPSRETRAETHSVQTAEQAKQRALAEQTTPVTFEQVLADPDNTELNFRYAKTQVAQGELLGAAGTLQRILLIHPEMHKIRLFYALVLMRLDNLEEAQRQLESVRGQKMPTSLRRQIDDYLRKIRLRRKLTQFFASLSIGVQHDTNRNAAPASKTRLLADIPLTVSGDNAAKSDVALLVIQSLGFKRDLGFQEGHELFGTVNYFLGEQSDTDDLDLQSVSFRTGGVYKGGNFKLTPAIFMSHMTLSRETFLRTQGLELRGSRPLSKRLSSFAFASWAREDYSGVTESSAAFQRKGDRSLLGGGGRYQLTPTMQIGGRGTYTKKNVAESFPFHAYTGYGVSGHHTWLLGKGQFLVNNLSWNKNFYKEPDFAISSRTRRDKQVRYRLTYGAPLTFFLGHIKELAPWIKETTATFTFERFRALSNVDNYGYKNTKFGAMLTKRVEF
jgi:thioredoxin-like negative regulator of GroEL